MTSKQILKRCPVFAALSSGEIEEIVNIATSKDYEAGVTIFHEHDKTQELLVLEEGKIALQVRLGTGPGQVSRKVTIDLINPDEVVGWSAVIEPYVYNFTGTCLQKCRVLAINGTRLRELMHANHHLGYEVLKGLIKVVASRLSDTRQLLVSERMLTPLE